MGRSPKYSKEIKIKACEDYLAGKGSFHSIAKSIGASRERVRQWYLRYMEHVFQAFETSNKNRTYSKEFKLSVINSYICGSYSTPELAAKWKIFDSTIHNWIKKYYDGVELKDYDPKGEIYIMKFKKTTYHEHIEIVYWVIEHNMNYKGAAKSSQ